MSAPASSSLLVPVVSTYDDLGRLESVTDADGTRTFEWDTAPSGIGRIARTTSGDDVAVAYTYEPRGLLETTTWTHGASQPTHESFTLGYVLPTGDAGPIIDVCGTQVRLIGGRVVDGVVRIASASRKEL